MKIKIAPGEAGKTLALSSANIVYGELAAESGTTVRKIIPFNEAMVVYFDEVMGASEYTVSYGTDKDHLDQSVKASGGKATIKGVASPQLTAEILLCAYLGKTKQDVFR